MSKSKVNKRLEDAFWNDGAKWSVSDLYESAAKALEDALLSGEDFDTGWWGVKKEIRSGRVSRIGDQVTVEASATDDFDTEGNGMVVLTAKEATMQRVIEALGEAEQEAEADRSANEQYAGFRVAQLKPDGSVYRSWVYTFVSPRDDSLECPPGDCYSEWGWDSDAPPADQMRERTRLEMEAYMSDPKNFGRSHDIGCWRMIPWSEED